MVVESVTSRDSRTAALSSHRLGLPRVRALEGLTAPFNTIKNYEDYVNISGSNSGTAALSSHRLGLPGVRALEGLTWRLQLLQLKITSLESLSEKSY